MRRFRILLSFLAVLISTAEIQSKEITLFSNFTDPSPRIQGEKDLLERKFVPASTLKYWITLYLLERNFATPSLKITSVETHIPDAPRDLDLREAMYYSSNSFFLSFFEEDPSRYSDFEEFLRKIGFVPTIFKKHFLDKRNLYKSEAVLVSPKFQHTFMTEFLKDEGKSKGIASKVFLDWKNAAFWSDCAVKNSVVYGKTGSLSGAFWFSGFLEKKRSFFDRYFRNFPNDYTVITVLQTGTDASREGAIDSFYRLAGCPRGSIGNEKSFFSEAKSISNNSNDRLILVFRGFFIFQ
ncbi:hypothetical protein EHQ12_11775 [Leptospira gomenensis]|uniref:Penicillin-binding protein transpeptidase domain-containing protein n=1 Tax=Leptospira gomenensis TaxID=2484974 RepID=A0A5F1YYZ9_9LEPT|nr:penicillin-binding transpeptidase domain-containing protein [Leptospira gomenensis]TGK34972.1 hypothetical protein EHQ17_08050 [Leptospira gomenensis]TGK36768.1 hypothetical protein EHQ12_11775 [Leptospira gomenensis]TGK48827.1 hypothetical protein EHQ07_05660 [Leptospira gomenensis]TGK64593.1 hypothetical protein EHQ13_06835 [Leptospira gomenensis]